MTQSMIRAHCAGVGLGHSSLSDKETCPSLEITLHLFLLRLTDYCEATRQVARKSREVGERRLSAVFLL